MTNATSNAEQQKKLDALLGSPEFVTRAFSSYAESQLGVHRARLCVWQIEATLWMILHVALVAALLAAYMIPEYSRHQGMFLVAALVSSLIRVLVSYSVPRP